MYGPVPSCYTCESDLYPDVNLMWVWKATSQILGKWASSGWRRCCQMQNSSQLLAIVTANVYLWNNEFVTVTAQFLNLAFELQWLSALNNVQLCQAKELSWKIFCVTRSVDLDGLTLSNSEEKKIRLLSSCKFVLSGRKIYYCQDYHKPCGLWPGCCSDSCHDSVVRGPSWEAGKKKDILTMFMIMKETSMERILRSSVTLCYPEVVPFTQSSLEMTSRNCFLK